MSVLNNIMCRGIVIYKRRECYLAVTLCVDENIGYLYVRNWFYLQAGLPVRLNVNNLQDYVLEWSSVFVLQETICKWGTIII